MFCSNCGAEARGNFCSACGEPLTGAPRAAEAEEVVRDWSRETRYEKLIHVPEVREMIDRHAAMAGKRATGEEFLALFEKAIPLGVPLGKIAPTAQALYAQMGIKTGKQRSEILPAAPGVVLVAVLCSLARHGQTVRKATQFEDGCLLEAAIPSDLRSFEGDLHISVRREGEGTRVDAATKISGQLFDWGKSNRCLDQFFNDLRTFSPGSPIT